MDGDTWTPFMFDQAVLVFGAWFEAKINETDAKGKPRHSVRDLLAEPKKGVEAFLEAAQKTGVKKFITPNVKRVKRDERGNIIR